MAGGNNFIYEGWPVVGPFLFEDGDKHEIEFVEERALCFHAFFRARALDNEVDDKIPDAYK